MAIDDDEAPLVIERPQASFPTAPAADVTRSANSTRNAP